jgi:hypothetical protein
MKAHGQTRVGPQLRLQAVAAPHQVVSEEVKLHIADHENVWVNKFWSSSALAGHGSPPGSSS